MEKQKCQLATMRSTLKMSDNEKVKHYYNAIQFIRNYRTLFCFVFNAFDYYCMLASAEAVYFILKQRQIDPSSVVVCVKHRINSLYSVYIVINRNKQYSI